MLRHLDEQGYPITPGIIKALRLSAQRAEALTRWTSHQETRIKLRPATQEFRKLGSTTVPAIGVAHIVMVAKGNNLRPGSPHYRAALNVNFNADVKSWSYTENLESPHGSPNPVERCDQDKAFSGRQSRLAQQTFVPLRVLLELRNIVEHRGLLVWRMNLVPVLRMPQQATSPASLDWLHATPARHDWLALVAHETDVGIC
jgi:hypothetical protein